MSSSADQPLPQQRRNTHHDANEQLLNPSTSDGITHSTYTAHPGDSLIPDAAMVYNRTRLINAPPSTIWPWIVQLGKNRGGWYLPSFIERFLPQRWLAAHAIDSRWQGLAVGDRVDDYGGQNEYFDVVAIEPPHALVYRSERFGTTFTWAILLREQGEEGTAVTLRFRGRIRSTGLRRRVIVVGGDFLDWATTAPMLRGLAERAEGVWRVEKGGSERR